MSKTNQENKRFNLMDVIIILLALLCIAGIIIRVGRFDIFDKGEILNRYNIRFSISNIAYTSEEYLIPGTLRLADHDMNLGTFTGVESSTPAVVYLNNEQGRLVRVQYPPETRIDVIGNVTVDGKTEGNNFLLDGKVQLLPGCTYRVQSEYMDFTIKILDIEKK